MITLHNPTSATYQQFDDWGAVAAAIDGGQLLLNGGILLTSTDCLREHHKQTGEMYADTGVTVPFANDDALALLQVRAAFDMGVTGTVIQLSNGAKLPMTTDDFPSFAAWFVQRRNAFFTE